MTMLSLDVQGQARDFILAHARPLEQAIYAYEFEAGDLQSVWTALSAFQNADGGFGNALEPDFRLPDSSVLATTVGLQVLRAYAAPATHPLVEGAMRYLLHTYDADASVWPIIPSDADEAPHAPWWGYSDDIADNWGGFLVNPRAEILGYLYDYADLVPADLRQRVTAAQMRYLQERADDIGMFDVLCYVRLAETATLPPVLRDDLLRRLTPIVDRLVVKDPTEWEKYVLTPLEVVDGPESPLAGLLADEVARELDFVIDHQGPSGAWEPKWTWGGMHPDLWPQARAEWSGMLTVRMLQILQRFDRLEV